MTTEKILHVRSDSQCELCGAADGLRVYHVPPEASDTAQTSVLTCRACAAQIENSAKLDAHHWRCLNDSMWNSHPAVQVMAWRLLKRLSGEAWARDLLEMLYLDDETLAWAKATVMEQADGGVVTHLDANGTTLTAGDTVTLIKDLNVKGAGFTAKRGTSVRNISLVPDNAEHIEGRVNGQQIVILTKFVKRAK